MAKKKISNLSLVGQTVSVLLILFVISALVLLALQFQNYTLSISSKGIRWKPRIQVGSVSNVNIDNSYSKKLILHSEVPSGTNGVQFRLSTSKRLLWLAPSYQTDKGYKIVGRLRGGKIYYVQARSFKKGVLNRNVYGTWTTPKAVEVRD